MTNHLFHGLTAAADGGAPFLEKPDGDVWTYGALLALSAGLAAGLVAIGLKPGDRVAAQVEKSPEALLLYLATVRAGGVFLPLNVGYTAAEIDYFVGDAEPKLFVCGTGVAERLKPVAEKHGARIETLDGDGSGSLMALAKDGGGFGDVARGPDDLAALLYTSGTTGRSKGAMLTHGNLLSNALALKDAWGFTGADRLIHALPIFHTHGLFVATNTIMVAGASMVFLPKFDPAQVLSLMDRATTLMGVPTFYVRLCEHPGLTKEATAKMRLFVSGSAPLLAETHKAFSAKTGHAILERYGMTETNMITSNPYEGDRVPGAVGFPLPGVELRVADPETGAAIADGDVGMIEVKGPNVFKGYWRMPEKTNAEFRPDGFFITGDLGKRDDRGYVWIVGRGKDLVISGGYNIYPKEVEAEIDQMEGVIESAVIGVAHPDFGEGVTACVVREKGASVDEAAVLAALKDRLARFKQPKRVIFVDELPRNAMGKVQKALLRETYADLYKG